ncbi:MAG TPA: Rne/Rng family ribonuclease [Desulfobacteraceae bacterium]|nr:Rne/Rng family ribonuclease [Deltaproteobacteria bacterium]HDI60159.1 Rne/Rng family ribonuclease [Desulfobacteraceae bacterium]
MSSKILINAVDTEECRIAKVTDSKLEEFHIESASREITHGNIYKGVIVRIEPSLQAVFVDYGAERHGFLQLQEIHPDYYQPHREGDHAIGHLVRKGQEIMVQVEKDPINKKGAMLTTYISLPGRFVVLMPGSDSRGISRKIESEEERARLKEIIASLKLPENFGIILRTAGEGCTKTSITKDFNTLMRLWRSIKDMVMKVPTPSLLYKERNLVLRSLRDYFTPDVDEVMIDDPNVYQETRKFMQMIAPKQTQSVKLYKGAKPLFTKFQLEEQIASVFESRVSLKSGGSIVIDQTEALVAIDVNSGKATQQRSIEETALQTNLEAAEEIARQLRLRDLGGLIVLDFIDMRETKHRNAVERALKEHLKIDKARTRVGRISKFGLMEMSRQRLRPSIVFGGYTTCPHCNGRGLTPTVETLAVAFLRELSLKTLKGDIAAARCQVPVPVAHYLLNRKRRELLDLEQRRDISISIEGVAQMVPGQSDIHLEQRAQRNTETI